MDRQAPYLREMGLVRWRFGSGGGGRSEPEPGSPPSGADVGGRDETPGLLSLAEKARHCERCELHRTRGKVVFGSGSPGARWFFVGEAPGAEEDKQGVPFVGRAGALLNAMLLAIGLSRESVYIANVLKCRPPNNRDPFGLEVQECSPFLHAQIELIQHRSLWPWVVSRRRLCSIPLRAWPSFGERRIRTDSISCRLWSPTIRPTFSARQLRKARLGKTWYWPNRF